MKVSAATNRMDAFDALGEFINENMDATLTVMHTPGQKPMRDNNRPYIADILVRYDLFRKTYDGKFESGTVLVERTKLRKWLSTRGYDYKAFVQEFEVEGIIATPKSQKAYFGKDVGIKACIAIPEENLYSDELFVRYVLAESKINIGRLLGTFGYNLPGGVTINATAISTVGTAEKQEVMDMIKSENTPNFFLQWN
jgi:hypothetical protein